MISEASLVFGIIFLIAEGVIGTYERNIIQDISVESLVLSQQLCLRVRWKAIVLENSSLDIDVIPKANEHCSHTLCHEYGISPNVSEIIFPNDTDNFSMNQGCTIQPNCTYHIKVATSRRDVSKTITYSTPVCVERICDCSHSSLLPKAQISAKILPTNSIVVEWRIPTMNASQALLSKRHIALKHIYIRVSQYTHTSQAYEKVAYIVENLYSLIQNTDGNFVDSKTVEVNTTLLPETFLFLIIAEIRDNYYCSGPEQNFTIDCIENKCICRHDSKLPKTQVSAVVMDSNTIKVSWSISLDNILEIVEEGVNLKELIIRIQQSKHMSPKWESVGTYSIPLSKSLQNGKKEKIDGSKVIGMPSTILPGTSFQIFAHVKDNFSCQGPQNEFLLIATSIGSDLQQQSTTFHSTFISIVVPTILLVLAIVCVSHYICKNIKKTASPNWMCVYRNTDSIGNIRPIPMEENLLYSEKYTLERTKADIFEIPFESIKFKHEIGGGAFGKVFKAVAQTLFCMPGPTVVAVKEMKRTSDPGAKEEFLDEIQTMKNIGRHENVVELLGYCTVKEPFLIVMEFVKYGALIDYLHAVRSKHNKQQRILVLYGMQDTFSYMEPQKPELKYLELQHSHSTVSDNSYITEPSVPATTAVRPSLTETTYTFLPDHVIPSSESSPSILDYILDSKELHNFAVQIAKGMRHLEEKGITHRDLAARNVLIGEGKILKISDFGLSRQGIYINTRCKQVPLRWLSIEAMRDNLYSSKSDVWAFGVVLWEIGTLGAFPYPTLNNQELLPFLSSNKRLEKPEICTNFLYKMMNKCWDEDPELRPSFKEIVDMLQPQNQKIYVEFSCLDPDYVFPPTKKEVFENKNKE